MSINWRKILTLCLLINADVSYKELRIIFHIESYLFIRNWYSRMERRKVSDWGKKKEEIKIKETMIRDALKQ